MTNQELAELLKRRLEGLPSQHVPLASPWINEVLPLMVTLGRKIDEIARRLEKVERLLEEVKQLLTSRS